MTSDPISEDIIEATEAEDQVEAIAPEEEEDDPDTFRVPLLPFKSVYAYAEEKELPRSSVDFMAAKGVQAHLTHKENALITSGSLFYIQALDLVYSKAKLRRVLEDSVSKFTREAKTPDEKRGARLLGQAVSRKDVLSNTLLFGFRRDGGDSEEWVGAMVVYQPPKKKLSRSEYRSADTSVFAEEFFNRGGEFFAFMPPAREESKLALALEVAHIHHSKPAPEPNVESTETSE